MKKLKFYTCLLVLFAFAQAAFAQATLSVQGTVQKSTGAAVDDGDYKLTFKLYTTETGGTPVWSETQDPVTIIGGVYSVTLGSVTPLSAAFDQTYYLGITVGTGAELTPRARLTSSPYALSLIGQNNIFPSTGAVGAGTAAPTAGYQLHVKNAAGDGSVLVQGSEETKVVLESTDGAAIEFKKGANTASITYDGTNINVENLNLSSYSPAQLAVTSKLAVGQNAVDANFPLKVAGNSQITGYLEVTGLTTAGSGVYKGLYCDYGHCGTNTVTASNVSIKASGSVYAQGLWSYSDRRIKKDFRLSAAAADLTTLKNLRVTDYRHVDEIAKGSDFRKGFVAQEVVEVFPEAISLYSDFVPNVYALSSQVLLKNGLLHIQLEQKHDFAVGDEVKLMMPDNSEQKMVVSAVPSEKSFLVNWTETAPEKVFVFGKKVDDFHTVDYDRIYTLNVSATQELARRVEQLEAENASLRQCNEGLQKQNDGLRSDVNNIFQRLQTLEKRSNLEK